MDHSYWTRVEEMTIDRPSFKIDSTKPGSDLAGETSAALTTASLAFLDSDSAYSDELLKHAKELFNFADTYRGKYSDSVPAAASFYRYLVVHLINLHTLIVRVISLFMYSKPIEYFISPDMDYLNCKDCIGTGFGVRKLEVFQCRKALYSE